jgi:hypothetical protein
VCTAELDFGLRDGNKASLYRHCIRESASTLELSRLEDAVRFALDVLEWKHANEDCRGLQVDFLMLNAHEHCPERMGIVDLVSIIKRDFLFNHGVHDLTNLASVLFHDLYLRPLARRRKVIPIVTNMIRGSC